MTFRHSPLFPRFACVSLLFCALSLPAAVWAEEDEDDPYLWRSGKNQYVKLVEQEDSLGEATLPNEHPVVLSPQEVRDALGQLRRWEEAGYFSDRETTDAFSNAQRHILGQAISAGLARAQPGQEIVFALAGTSNPDSSISFLGTMFSAGRVFYQGGRLHLILGDYRRPRDKGAEAMAGQFGEYEIAYRFSHGRRSSNRATYKLEEPFLKVEGITQMQQDGGSPRLDWLVFDLEAVTAHIRKEKEADQRRTPTGMNAEQLRQAKKERFEMRAEMARLRNNLKKLRESAQSDSGGDIKKRMATLNQLREDGLISDEEYREKRQAILDEI